MEHINGGELFDFIVLNRELDEPTAFKFLSQILEAVESMHQMGISHRDLKPENILLEKSSDNLKIIDFGLSNMFKQGEKLKTACGSPCYAAPEMIAGKAYEG